MMIMPTVNENRLVYNPVGGNAAAIRCVPYPRPILLQLGQSAQGWEQLQVSAGE